MFLGGCSPAVVSGLEHLPKEGEAALLCANHASWFDIPLIAQVRGARCIPPPPPAASPPPPAAPPPRPGMLPPCITELLLLRLLKSGAATLTGSSRWIAPRHAQSSLPPHLPASPPPRLPSPSLPASPPPCLSASHHPPSLPATLPPQFVPTTFKFVASASLRKLPLIGQQLVGGKHVLIDRKSRKGQLKSFKESIAWLKKGVQIMAFPEGTRTKSGRMGKFKGGTFAMSAKTGAPIIPISLVGTFAMYPPEVMLPLRPARDLEIHVHPPIYPEGKTEEELAKLTRDAIASKLPPECR